jgi:hypothetical protein
MIKLHHSLLLMVFISFFLTLSFPYKIPAQTVRDAWLWPFAQDSIWNMPIGNRATYASANLGRYGDEYVDYDFEYMIKLKSDDPEVSVYYPGGFNRCEGTTLSWLGKMRVPYSFITEQIRQGYTPNNVATFLQPDGKTIWQMQPTARCVQGGPIYGYPFIGTGGNTETLYGQGEYGTHYGSGLSGIGGSLRKGELIGSAPIRHALKINLWGKRYLYNGNPNGYGVGFGYRWPARMSDTGADDPNSDNAYLGTNPELAMGSLLAIPPHISQSSLGLQTEVGKKLFYTLKNFGAYVVDNTAWYPITLCGEKGVPEEVKDVYGYDMLGNSSPIAKDILKLYQQLYVVTNNSPNSKGGPGTRLAPLAPSFGSEGSGKGLSAVYYDNIDFTGAQAKRVDSTVNFNWGSGAPASGVGADTFSVRWTGQVEAPATGTYTFITNSDDGVRLWVNGTQLVNNWTNHGPTENSGNINLTAGQKYSIKLEYYENTAGAVIQLFWIYPGQTKQIVPQSRLYEASSTGISNGRYRLTAKHSGKVMEVADGLLTDGGNVQQWSYANVNQQKWNIESIGDGYYKITAVHSGKALDVASKSTSDGANIHQWSYGGGSNQQWKIESVGNGYYRIVSRNSGKCVDVSGPSTADGANVHQWRCHGGDNQAWKLEVVQ